jgi:hypothetical protein
MGSHNSQFVGCSLSVTQMKSVEAQLGSGARFVQVGRGAIVQYKLCLAGRRHTHRVLDIYLSRSGSIRI